jgi:protein-disulfide isomerase
VILSKAVLLTLCAALIGVPSVSYAEKALAPSKLPFPEEQKTAMEEFVRDYILNHPEVLMESVNRFRANEEKKKEEGSLTILKENMGFVTNGKHPEIGNPKGDVTVIEFFDYNCGYCKHAMQTVRELAEKDKNVRIIFMEYPILSPLSTTASKWAVAANMQGKYWEFHQALLESKEPKEEANLAKMAEKIGLDVVKLKKDAEGKDVESYMESVRDFGQKLSVSGTPAFIIGGQIIRGYVEYPAFKTIVEDERKKTK